MNLFRKSPFCVCAWFTADSSEKATNRGAPATLNLSTAAQNSASQRFSCLIKKKKKKEKLLPESVCIEEVRVSPVGESQSSCAENDPLTTDIKNTWSCEERLGHSSLKPFCVKNDLQLPQIHITPWQLSSQYFPCQVSSTCDD